jgi:hypothetical protein
MDGRLPPAPAVVVTLRADFVAAASYLGATATRVAGPAAATLAMSGLGRSPGPRASPRGFPRPEGHPDPAPIPARDPQDHARV